MDWCLQSSQNRVDETMQGLNMNNTLYTIETLPPTNIYNCQKLWEDEIKFSLAIFILMTVCYVSIEILFSIEYTCTMSNLFDKNIRSTGLFVYFTTMKSCESCSQTTPPILVDSWTTCILEFLSHYPITPLPMLLHLLPNKKKTFLIVIIIQLCVYMFKMDVESLLSIWWKSIAICCWSISRC